MKDNH